MVQRASAGSTTPSWLATAKLPHFPRLSEDRNTEVCVIGAGIAGLTTAYLLCLEGRKVIVLEDGEIGSGETGRTTAHISNAFDDRYVTMEKIHGGRKTQLIAESHTAAIERIAHIVEHEHIECGFRYLDGYLFAGPGAAHDLLAKEYAAAQRAGLRETQLVAHAPCELGAGGALMFPKQATFHPLQYLAGLSRAITRLGGKIYTGTHVDSIQDGTLVAVGTSIGKTVYADALVVATNSPINTWVKIHTKQAPYRTFVIAIHVPKGTVHDALYWDSGDPYHYVRLQHVEKKGARHDLLIVGGEDHKTGQADDAEERFKRLERWARDRFDHLGKVEFRWSGQVMEPVDGVAYIGRSPGEERNVFMITGDSGNGITHATLGAMLVTDLVMERENPWESLYSPSRVSLHPSAALEYTKENANVAAQYADYLTDGINKEVASIPAGEGAVVQRGIHKLAMYRDPDGELHERSAVCTHLGCVVHWNSTEKSWDCPCHGSRFAPKGEVLNGPAAAPLSSTEQKHGDEASAMGDAAA